jgi:DNA invertase Pin-like site-specific DNA recombinase
MLRAALYARASTELQKYSTSNQIEALRHYADERGYSIVCVYEDDGRSGLDLRGRDGLRQLLMDVLAVPIPFEVLLVYDVSRWGRFQDPDEGAYYEFLCRRAGVEVIYCAEPFPHERGAMAAVIKSIKRAMAAEYSRELSRKVSIGQRRMILEGFCIGGVANFGLRRLLIDKDGRPRKVLSIGERKIIHTDRVILIPGPKNEVALVRRIFQMCGEERLGGKRIASVLNSEGRPSPGNGRWSQHTVFRILTNEKYVGTNVYGRTTGLLKQRRVNTPPVDWVRKEGAFRAIVPQVLFDKAQSVLGHVQRRLSDEEMISELKALLKEKGRLSCGLIMQRQGMPSPETYSCRFHGLNNAYRLAGYEPRRPTTPARLECDREALLQKLHELRVRRGKLSRRIIAADATMPPARLYRWEFGNLTNAYALIGYQQGSACRPRLDGRLPGAFVGL